MDELSLGVIATSRKKHEGRLPIHPRHLERIDADLRRRIFLEHGYGLRHGYTDDELEAQVGGLRTREQLIAESDVVVLPKPLHADVAALGPRDRSSGAGRTASRTPSSPSSRSTGGSRSSPGRR